MIGSQQADTKWALWNINAGLTDRLEYKWVESHQNQYKLWHNLTLEQQLKYYYNILVKEAQGILVCVGGA